MLVPSNTPRALVEVEILKSHLVTKCAIGEITIQLIVEKFSILIDYRADVSEVRPVPSNTPRALVEVETFQSHLATNCATSAEITIQLTGEKFSKVIFSL